MDQLFGHAFPNAGGVPEPAPKMEMPYYPVVMSMQNPTGKKTTLSDCVLKIRFYEREGEYESTGYITEESLKSLVLHEAPIVTVESGAMARVEWLFFFLPHPTLKSLLSDKSTQAFRFQAGCRDEAGREIVSAWR
jgi:hypothetical protein